MKLATFYSGTEMHVGIVEGDTIFDLTSGDPAIDNMVAALETDHEALKVIASKSPTVKLPGTRLAAPVPNPRKFLAIGYNYTEHLNETGMKKPEWQVWFNKQQTCIVGPGDDVWLPTVAPDQIDYEGELGLVIGKKCKNVPSDKAAVLDVIAGFTIINDVSVRDWQEKEPGMVVSKSFDTHGPIGPWIVTTDEIGDPLDLTLKTWLNDDLRQDGHTGDMLFNIYEQVSYLSTAFTLEVGDVLATGTPSGIAWHHPDKYMKAGDKVRVEIEKIGYLENSIVAEPV